MQASTPLSQMHVDDIFHYTTIVSLANTIQMYWPFCGSNLYVAGLIDFSEDWLFRITKSTTNICLWHLEDEGPLDHSYSAAM